ncbi:hypothetical protein GCM10011409_44330 [Lentibacillus populi]|uniref:Resolvase/invertase-type recombinase catalytic domain-containing protein n=1 Tax=Lentibacillus populi TaxID=1827502 RepID=A0A9W5U1Q6_9BACI|nr:recombinase family protein [Lentibacillus populi]GGB62278.1 hypothetical protein GCM10011409_44330 [Lentibacillus populi]
MNCAVYIRTASKNHQNKHVAIQSQKINDYVSQKQWTIYKQYVDIGSGTTRGNSLKKMIEDAKLGKFNMIIATDSSRLLRNKNSELSYQLKALCENKGVNIITLDNTIDTLTNGNLELGLLSWFYEQESHAQSQRIKAGIVAAKMK